MKGTLIRPKGTDIISSSSDIREAAVVRTLISLSAEDKRWLEEHAKKKGLPMAEVVRDAIRWYKASNSAIRDREVKEILRKTAGIWQNGDGLAWQRKLRAEWR